MRIREAIPDDNIQLQQLQGKCPQGTSLIVSTVNTPDFFARAKAYETCKVYVAYEENRLVGSAACAIRNATVNSKTERIGYEFQYFTLPECRRKGIAKQLRHQIQAYLTQHGAALSYALIMERNLPSMQLVEREGFKLHRTLVMRALIVRKEMAIPSNGVVRPARPEDLVTVAALMNQTWQSRELYETASAEMLAQFISRTPAFCYDNLLVLENKGEILACLGFWDWSQIIRITVKALNPKMRLLGWLLVNARILPRFLKPGDTLKQTMLTLIGYKEPADLALLIKYLNNQVRLKGTEQIFCVCERDDVLLKSMKGMIHVDAGLHLYVKPLRENVLLGHGPVFVNGIDL